MGLISIRGAKEHNLKNIDIDIPKAGIVTFSGVSGSGKSSLVFDTLYAESFRRFADASQAPVFMMGSKRWAKITRPQVRSITGLPPALGLSQKQSVISSLSTVGTITGISDLLRVYFAAFGDIFCKKCDIPLVSLSFDKIIEKIFSTFNDQKVKIVATIAEKRKGAFAAEIEKFRDLGFSNIIINGVLYNLNDKIKIDAKKPNTISVVIDVFNLNYQRRARLERSVHHCLNYANGLVKVASDTKLIKFNTRSSCPQCSESAPPLDPRHFSHSSLGKCQECSGTGCKEEGLHQNDLFPCRFCHGSRLSKELPIVRAFGKTYSDFQTINIQALYEVLKKEIVPVVKNDKSKYKIFGEIYRLSKTLMDLSLSHITLNRSGISLAPGDLQRLYLASMLSNQLKNVLYIIDEPCQGLTSLEVYDLVHFLKTTTNAGATVVAVEHHPEFLKLSDHLFIMGPGAGVHGGKILHPNTENFKPNDIEGKSLPTAHKKTDSDVVFKNFSVRNISKERIDLKQNTINVLRGPSGKGKSSFIDLCLLPFLNSISKQKSTTEISESILFQKFCQVKTKNDVIVNTLSFVRPGTMGKSYRRNVASALQIIEPLREIFASLPASQILGLTPMHFSWNSKLGQCENCRGRGFVELPQRYSKFIRIECEVCHGSKLKSNSLLPRFKNMNFAEILKLSLEDALKTFENHTIILNRIKKSCEFGLGYVFLGQTMDSLSGGEVQRMNLTLELRRANLEGSWFILFHPSTGLHSPDINILCQLMQTMCTRGATFVAVDNREEFLAYAHNVVNFM